MKKKWTRGEERARGEGGPQTGSRDASTRGDGETHHEREKEEKKKEKKGKGNRGSRVARHQEFHQEG